MTEHGGVLHHHVGGGAADVHAREQPQVREAEVVLEADAAHAAERRDARVDEQAIDLVLAEAGVGDGALDRLGGEVVSAVAVHAAHLADAEPGDRRLRLQLASFHGRKRSGCGR